MIKKDESIYDQLADLQTQFDAQTKKLGEYQVNQERQINYLTEFSRAVNYLLGIKMPDLLSPDNYYEGIVGWYNKEMYIQELDRKLKYKISEVQNAGYTVTKKETV